MGLTTVGWREWLALPELGVPAIKAKVDTGARTSALHAVRLEVFKADGRERVRFWVQPLRKQPDFQLRCEADVADRRTVSDSGGHREKRVVIRSKIRLSDREWSADITLTDRYTMLFPMLLGRKALEGLFIVDPALSYSTGRSLTRAYSKTRKRQTKGE